MSEGREAAPAAPASERVMMGVEQWAQRSVGACLAFPLFLSPSLAPFVFNGACYVAMLFALASSSSSASIIAVELSFTFGRDRMKGPIRDALSPRFEFTFTVLMERLFSHAVRREVGLEFR